MQNRSRLKTDPFLIVLLLIIFGGGAWFHFKSDQPEATKPTSSGLVQISTLPSATVSGHLVFEHSFFDFGTVTEGEIVKHTFKFQNQGAGKAKIAKTETSCGCTTASGALKEYAPGESGEMEVVVDTKGKKGIVVKTVTLTL